MNLKKLTALSSAVLLTILALPQRAEAGQVTYDLGNGAHFQLVCRTGNVIVGTTLVRGTLSLNNANRMQRSLFTFIPSEGEAQEDVPMRYTSAPYNVATAFTGMRARVAAHGTFVGVSPEGNPVSYTVPKGQVIVACD